MVCLSIVSHYLRVIKRNRAICNSPDKQLVQVLHPLTTTWRCANIRVPVPDSYILRLKLTPSLSLGKYILCCVWHVYRADANARGSVTVLCIMFLTMRTPFALKWQRNKTTVIIMPRASPPVHMPSLKPYLIQPAVFRGCWPLFLIGIDNVSASSAGGLGISSPSNLL